MHCLLYLIYAYRMIGVWEISISSSNFYNITTVKRHAEVQIVTLWMQFLRFVRNMLKNSPGMVNCYETWYESSRYMECICISFHNSWSCKSRKSPPSVSLFQLTCIKTLVLVQRHLNTAYVCTMWLNVACRIVLCCAVMCCVVFAFVFVSVSDLLT
jgi:hypothetical protein